MNRPEPIRVLVVGFEPLAAQRRMETLLAAGFLAEFELAGDDLLGRLESAEWDIVLLEIREIARAEQALAVCHRLSEMDVERRVPVLLCGNRDDSTLVTDAFEVGALDFFSTTIGLEELAARLRAHARVHRECRALRLATIRDELTTLFNRTYLEDRLGEELSRVERYGGDLGLILLDVDEFKQINDQFGHATGDAALKRTGEIIRRTIRKTDLPARYGGDEFAVLLVGVETAHPGVVAERLRTMIETDSADFSLRIPPFTASIGATSLGPRMRDVDTLFAEADHALYASKRAGRNQATLFDSPLLADPPTRQRR